jgi:molybdopterin converting factor small subunit
MPTVRLKVSGWAHQVLDTGWAHPEGAAISVPEGKTITEMARQLAAESDVFKKVVFDNEDMEFGANVLVVLNGLIVDPNDRSGTRLKEGDEVLLLPIMDGG